MQEITIQENLPQEISLKWRQHAVRAIFFLSGLACATWAPMVPIIKQRLGITDDIMGMLLLCIGIGSMLSMPFSGSLAQKYGCRKILTLTGFCLIGILLSLSQVDSLYLTALCLLLFGSAMGFTDVVMNINAVLVEKISPRSIMSNYHGMWSSGCFVGAGLFPLCLFAGLSVTATTCISLSIMVFILLFFTSKLLAYGDDNPEKEKAPLIAIPKGIVVFFSIITCISFLVEGAVMDWSGIFITDVHHMDIALAGTGFSIYSAAMLLCRFCGDAAVRRLGQKRIALGGMLISCLGFLLLVFSPWKPLIFASFFLMGIGLANVVPVVFSIMGQQKDMPAAQAIAAVSTMGYLGVLGGPATIGFISNATSLNAAFGFLAMLIVAQILLTGYVFNRNN